jgi:hypothetical protein
MKPEENKPKESDVLGLATHLLGHNATTVVDVGARWGAREAWWCLHPLASLVGFEPDPGECQRLNQLAQDAKAEQYVAAAAIPTGSGRLFWGNAVYFRDYVAIADEKKLLILGALLDAVGDRDGAAGALRRISSMDVKRSIVQLEESS